MSDLRFSWDERKNAENKRKHRVSFEEAQTVFYDENAKLYHDPTLFMKIGSFCSASMASIPSPRCVPLVPRGRDVDPDHLCPEGKQYREEGFPVRTRYDFSKMKARKNPYLKHLKQPVTIRLDRETVAYFKGLAEESGLPYQSLINLYLRDCAAQGRKLSLKWVS